MVTYGENQRLTGKIKDLRGILKVNGKINISYGENKYFSFEI
jgi:hypothetical protein